jgi:hypothetical protein
MLAELWGVDVATDAIAGRLRTGLIVATAGIRAREVNTHPPSTVKDPLMPIPAKHWDSWPSRADPKFWKVGDVSLYGPTGLLHASYHDVRFHPEGIAALVPPAPPTVSIAPAAAPTPLPIPAPARAALSGDEAKRFSRAILEGWPESTEDFAWGKAKLFFPANKVSRDWFKGIFRSIRGHRNPGKQPKDRD